MQSLNIIGIPLGVYAVAIYQDGKKLKLSS